MLDKKDLSKLYILRNELLNIINKNNYILSEYNHLDTNNDNIFTRKADLHFYKKWVNRIDDIIIKKIMKQKEIEEINNLIDYLNLEINLKIENNDLNKIEDIKEVEKINLKKTIIMSIIFTLIALICLSSVPYLYWYG